MYHESVPGHHLQLAQMMYNADSLDPVPTARCVIPGHGEGWALYAERLMHELGYLDDPALELGWLIGQALRAVRVILDIGLHCEMRIPDSEAVHAGEVWQADWGHDFLIGAPVISPSSWSRRSIAISGHRGRRSRTRSANASGSKAAN